MTQIVREVAEAEINKWLDYKKVFASVREKNKDSVELLIEGIMNGTLTLNEGHQITHQLLVPLTGEGGETTVTSLTYKPRLNDKMLQSHMKGVANDDGDMRLLAIISALTGSMKGIVINLDSVDKKIAVAIAIFFI
jgi:hypothetical protein